MPQHYWGDDWPHWDDLYKAIRYFDYINRRFRGFWYLSKEKYGTMRLEYLYGDTSLDTWLLRKNCLVYRYPKTRKVSAFLDKGINFLRLNRVISAYMRLVFNLATYLTVRKYPQVKEEIMDEYEFNTLLYGWVKEKVGYECGWTDG